MGGFNGNYQAAVSTYGSGLGTSGAQLQETLQTRPPGTALPGPETFTLAAGNNIILLPQAPLAFTAILLLAPPGSANLKKFTDVSGTYVALTGWTYGSVTVPCLPGGSLYVQSVGGETLQAAYVP